MKLPHAPINSPADLTKRATVHIFTKIYGYINLVTNADSADGNRHRNYSDKQAEAYQYFQSINRSTNLTDICNNILFGRKYLLTLLPAENNPFYITMLAEYNSIVQFCFDQKRSKKDVSYWIKKEIGQNSY